MHDAEDQEKMLAPRVAAKLAPDLRGARSHAPGRLRQMPVAHEGASRANGRGVSSGAKASSLYFVPNLLDAGSHYRPFLLQLTKESRVMTSSMARLAGQVAPLEQPTADLDLEPGKKTSYAWRDKRWDIRWPHSADELASVTNQ